MHNKPLHLNNTRLEPHVTNLQHDNSLQHNSPTASRAASFALQVCLGLRQHRKPQHRTSTRVIISASQAPAARVIEALTGPDGLVCKDSGNGAARSGTCISKNETATLSLAYLMVLSVPDMVCYCYPGFPQHLNYHNFPEPLSCNRDLYQQPLRNTKAINPPRAASSLRLRKEEVRKWLCSKL